MTNRIGGPIPPESPRGSRGTPGVEGGKFQKSVERVEKAGEAELDKQRKRAFKRPREEEEEDEIEEAQAAPSPFETEFYLEGSLPPPPVGFEELSSSETFQASEEISSSGLQGSRPPMEENLPESQEFWEEVGLPDQPPPPMHFEEKRHLVRTHGKKEEKPIALPPKVAKKTPALPQEKPSESLYGKPSFQKKGAKISKKSLQAQSEEQLEETPPLSLPKATAEEPFAPTAKKTSQRPSKIVKEEEEDAFLEPAKRDTMSPKQWKEKEEQRRSEIKETAIPSPIPDPLPQSVQSIAQVAQTSASPFLNPQTASLFFQMVGTIVYMGEAKPGISLTEVTLNSPNFQNSIFYNSTITIEKYATAPDAFNIRLTGSPEAVNFFNNNIDSLSAAFAAAYDERRVNFKVNRLETSLSSERPLIRRKKEGGSKEGGKNER